MFYLHDLLSALTHQSSIPLDIAINGVEIDSRQVTQGSLFVALPGEQTDGHKFVQAAFENGAIAALIDQDLNLPHPVIDLRSGNFNPNYLPQQQPLCLKVANTLDALQKFAQAWREKHPIRTIGITGSVGKTTTKELTASLLAHRFQVLKNSGNRNNEIGLPLTLTELEKNHEYAVLEMGFYVLGEIKTLCEIARPDVGIITNIGTVHAERAGSQEIIAHGKAELVESLPPSPIGTAILNMDDPWVKWMADRTRAQILSYGINEPADLMASDIKSHGLQGISCTLTYQGQDHAIQTPLLGEFSAYTVLCATAAALVEGLNWDTITHALAESQSDIRMRHFKLNNGATIIDDTYNASPESTTAALNFLRGLKGRRVAVLGDMLELGQYEQQGHESVGEVAARCVDYLVLVGPRSKITAASAIKSGIPEKHIEWYLDSHQASLSIRKSIQHGDFVLIKGSNSMKMDIILRALEERT